MKLNELLPCNFDTEIRGISNNTLDIKKDELFVCTMGVTVDRHDFIEDAVSKGAAAIIALKPVKSSVPVVIVDDTNKTFVDLLQKFYDFPSRKMKMIGVTGTDGKTSVSTIIYELLNIKDNCGYIGTNGAFCKNYSGNNPNTTPGPEKLHPFLSHFCERGCNYTALEVTSEALAQNRVAGIDFDVTILTNITSDHLNIHGNIENYVREKAKLFAKTKQNGFSILNADDAHYLEIKDFCKEKIITYGIEDAEVDFYAYDIKLFSGRTLFKLKYKENIYEIDSPLECMFNVYNLMAAFAALVCLGFSLEELINKLSSLEIAGRMNHIDLGQDFKILIDYAHTINGISKLFDSVKQIYKGNYIVVTGIAGERDYTKRPKVGEIFIANATHTIFTSEDPRGEDPYKIINELLSNVKEQTKKYSIEINRMEAIRKAISMAKTNDIILILGKGTESYQKIKGELVYFNDYEAAKSILMDQIYSNKISQIKKH